MSLFQETSTVSVSQTMESRLDTFRSFTDIYKGNPYSTLEHQEWVLDMMQKYPDVCETTLVYHQEDTTKQVSRQSTRTMTDRIRDNLMYPTPIYWGRERDDLFSWESVESKFGYAREQANSMSDTERDTVRYAIVGKVKVKAVDNLPLRDAYVIHTEGVNLESKETPAYRALVKGRSRDQIMEIYFQRHRAMLKLVIEAAMSQVSEGEHAFIQAPLIGAGCFLRGLQGSGLCVEDFLKQQVLALQSVLNMAPSEYRFTYKLCIFNTGEFSNDIISMYQSMLSSYSCSHDKDTQRFMLGTNSDGGNVVGDVPYDIPNQKVFVVNAGDLRSCIGNGMRHDASVEGFIVANACGYNSQWQNTSFLHNSRFNSNLLDPELWKTTREW